jgi:hypothetical protein
MNDYVLNTVIIIKTPVHKHYEGRREHQDIKTIGQNGGLSSMGKLQKRSARVKDLG